ncbi:MAG: hypothetical protein ACOZE7_21065 [Pseudomonadota bacterium]
MHQVIHIHPEAPAKPAAGQPCNGCGVCCLAEPCPVGMLVSRKRHGACKALVWVEADHRYRCGLMLAGQRGSGLWRKAWHRWAARWISAGSGCDASLEIEAAPEQNQQFMP